jgi:hypothetical protein
MRWQFHKRFHDYQPEILPLTIQEALQNLMHKKLRGRYWISVFGNMNIFKLSERALLTQTSCNVSERHLDTNTFPARFKGCVYYDLHIVGGQEIKFGMTKRPEIRWQQHETCRGRTVLHACEVENPRDAENKIKSEFWNWMIDGKEIIPNYFHHRLRRFMMNTLNGQRWTTVSARRPPLINFLAER